MSDALMPAKHGRDHCPGGIDPIPCLSAPKVFRASMWNNSLEVGTGVDMEQLLFDLWANPDDTVFAEVLSGGSLATIELLQPGLVIASLIVDWVDGFDASVAGLIADGEGVWPPMGTEHTRKMRAGFNTGMSYLATLSRYYPTLDWEESHGFPSASELPEFSFYAGHASGVLRDVQGRVDITFWPAEVGPVESAP